MIKNQLNVYRMRVYLNWQYGTVLADDILLPLLGADFFLLSCFVVLRVEYDFGFARPKVNCRPAIISQQPT